MTGRIRYDSSMSFRFNAPVWAFLVVLAAYAPTLFPSITSWPPVGAFLLVGLVLTIVGLKQERLLGSVSMLLVLFIAGPFQMFIVPFLHAASFGHGQQQAATVAQFATTEESSSSPAARAVGEIARSQQAAVRKYPGLAIKNSPMNTVFVARYTLWTRQNDPRLSRPDWPERLADDCAGHP